MRPVLSRSILSAALALAMAAASALPVQAGDGFLKHLDTLMRNYADSFYKEGSPGDVAEKFFRGGNFGLKAIDQAMRAYGDASQKVGEQAWTDLKVVLKDLLDVKTYLPGPLKKAWEALVAELAVLKARFLARCENPWADDPPAGGSAAAEVPSAAPEAAPESGAADGALPEGEPAAPLASGIAPGGAGGAVRASSIRPRSSRRVARVVGAREMEDAFDEFVRVRKNAQRGIEMIRSLEAGRRAQVQEKLVRQAHEMEDMLLAKLRSNPTALKALSSYLARLDRRTAQGSFRRLLTRLTQALNAAALADRRNARARERAAAAASLKARILG
jgi:hypothetical protein